FYAVHRERPFFGELVDFMISGPVVVQVLEGNNAITGYRDIMGATDPAKAAAGTNPQGDRKLVGEESVHGSEAPGTAGEGNCPILFRQRNRRVGRSSQEISVRSPQKVTDPLPWHMPDRRRLSGRGVR